MDNHKDSLEVQAIRRALNQLRSEFDLLCKYDPIGFISDNRGFDRSLVEAGPIGNGDRIMRRYAMDETKRHLDAPEQRIAALEARYGVNATLN